MLNLLVIIPHRVVNLVALLYIDQHGVPEAHQTFLVELQIFKLRGVCGHLAFIIHVSENKIFSQNLKKNFKYLVIHFLHLNVFDFKLLLEHFELGLQLPYFIAESVNYHVLKNRNLHQS